MKRRHLKSISLLLTVIMIMCAIPMTAFATDQIPPILEGTTQDTDVQIFTDTLDYDNPDVLRPITEMESRREENVKHFLLPDGKMEAIVYGSAVHRKNSLGEWTDIDNTLSGENGKLPHLYVTDDLRVAFAKNFSVGGQLFALNENGYGISMKLMEEPISTLPVPPITEIASSTNPVSTTTVVNAPTRENKTQWSTIDEARTVNNASSIIYTNVRSNTDLEYILDGNDVKENIIVKAAGNSYVYSFELELSGLTATLCEDGRITLSDIESGETEYIIPAPYMYDANGEISYGVYYTLTESSEGVYILKITADSQWINAENREFPVTIDPTVKQGIFFDTYIDSGNPTSNYGSSSQLWVSSTKTSFIKVDMPELPSGSDLSAAYLYVAYYYYDNVTSNSLTASAHTVNMPWSEGSLNWNTANTYSDLGISTSVLSYAYCSGAEGAYNATPKWVSFSVKEAVSAWYSGKSSNNGIAIKRYGGTNDFVLLKSYESGSTYTPYFSITYIEPRVTDGVYKIKNNATGKYIDVTDGATADGTQLQQRSVITDDDNRSQLFKIEFIRNYNTLNYYTIRPLTNCGQSINIPEVSGTVTVEDLPTTGTSAIPWNQSIAIMDVGGHYVLKSGHTSVTQYLAALSSGTDGSKLYSESAQPSNTYWTLEPYTTDIEGIEFESSPANLVTNETYMYKAVMYSSTIGRNGPVQYLVKNADGTDTDKATINATTGELTELNAGTIRVGVTYTGATKYWYIKVDIKFENGIIYTLKNTSDNMYMRPINSDASNVILSALNQTDTALMWKFKDNGDGYFFLKNEYREGDKYNGYYLCAPDNTMDGALITQKPYSETGSVDVSRVLWKFIRQSDGTFKIQSKNNEGTSLYLTNAREYVAQSASNVTTWDIKPLIMNVKVMYDQAFSTRYSANYEEVLRGVYENNSNDVSIASVYKERFGIRVNVTFESTAYESLPYTNNCGEKDNINTLCFDCKYAKNDTVNKECIDGFHHKSQRHFVRDITSVLLNDSKFTKILYTGHVACGVNETGAHTTIADGVTSTGKDASVIFGAAFERANIIAGNYDMMIRTTAHETLHLFEVNHCAKSDDSECIMNSTEEDAVLNLSMCSLCQQTVNLNKLWLFNHE